MSLKTFHLAIGASAAFLAAGANAATIDFSIPTSGFTVESYTNIAGYNASGAINASGNITGETGFATVVLDVAGENLDIYIDDPTSGNPYFDADSGGPGGLGSCRAFKGDANTPPQCAPNSDDNLTIGQNESLLFEFKNNNGDTQLTNFGEFLFYDDNHDAITGTIRVTHDGGMSTINVTGGVGDLLALGASTFLLFNDAADTTKASTNYYITQATVSAVPIPAAAWLFGSALIGLAGVTRKRKLS